MAGYQETGDWIHRTHIATHEGHLPQSSHLLTTQIFYARVHLKFILLLLLKSELNVHLRTWTCLEALKCLHCQALVQILVPTGPQVE